MNKYPKRYAKNYKCRHCKKKKADAFWPIVDPDIPSHPYCRTCLDKAQMEVLIKMSKSELE